MAIPISNIQITKLSYLRNPAKKRCDIHDQDFVIGAGGVGSVATHKMAMLQDVFSDITLASRREVKCQDIADSVMARWGARFR